MTDDRFAQREPAMDRRAFVAASTAAAVGLSLAGRAPSVEKMAETGDAPSEPQEQAGVWTTISCMQSCGGRCLNKALVEDGVILRQKTDDTHEDSQEFPQQRGCLRGRAIGEMAFGADRIKYPLKRKGWQPGGKDFHPELRGRDEWERISWDEAIRYVADETKRIYSTYGPRSVLVPSAFGSALHGYLGGYVGMWDTNSQGSARLGPSKLGLTDNAKRGQCNDRYDMATNAETIVLYGCNPAWSAMGSPTWHFLAAKERGAQFVFVGPTYNASASMLEARWVRTRPGTDTALLLAVAYEMVRQDEAGEGLIDWDFLHTYCIGFDEESPSRDGEHFLGYVRGDYDGVPKTPEWASEICGTPAEDITWLARELGCDKAVFIASSFAAYRCNGAEDLPQLMMTVGAMGGHFGKPGHACGVYYADSASDGPVNLILTGGSGEAEAAEALGVDGPDFGFEAPDDLIGSSELWRAVATGSYRFIGNPCGIDAVPGEERTIDIRMIENGNWSPMRSLLDTNQAVEALRGDRVEFVVNRSFVPRLDAQYADIILPLCSDLERDGGTLMGTGDGGREVVFCYSQVCEPVYESKSSDEIDNLILEAMGYDHRGLHPLSERQKTFNEIAGTTVADGSADNQVTLVSITQEDIDAWGVEGTPQEGLISWSEFREKGVYQIPRSSADDGYGYIAYEDFVADPQKNPRESESGKFEICCQWKADALNAMGYSEDTYKPYPTYHVPVEGFEQTFDDWGAKKKGDYPFQCYNPHYMRFANGVFGNTMMLASILEHPVFMNNEDATALGIEDGDTVLVSSRYGSVLRHASLSPLTMPGCVGLPNGAWTQFDENGVDAAGAVNSLTGSVCVGMGTAGYNTLNVKVEPYAGAALRADAAAQVVLAANE